MGKVEDWMRRTNRLGFKPPTDITAVKAAVISLLVDEGPKKTYDIIRAFRGQHGEEAVKRALGYLSGGGYSSRPNREDAWPVGTPKPSGFITSNEIRGVVSNLTV